MDASIVIRAFNAEKTLRRAIESALNQDIASSRYEILIVDDGSTDRTAEIVHSYTDAHIRLVQQENRGLTGATTTGIQESEGATIHFLDADDEILPQTLTLFLEVMVDATLDCAYSDYFEEYEGKRTLVIPSDPFKAPNGAYVWRRESLLSAGSFSSPTIFPEYEMLLRMWGKWNIGRIARPVFVYHRSVMSLTGKRERVEDSIAKLIAQYPQRSREIELIRSYALG